jgi:PAS domain S-box-containing protein
VHTSSVTLRYSLALGFTAGAILLRWLIDPWLGDSLPLVTLYGAIALAAWLSGYRPAVLASVAGYLAADLLFMPPRGEALSLGSSADMVGLLAYMISCGIIIGFGESARRSRTSASQSEEALRSAREKLNVVVSTMAARVAWCSRDLKYLWVSKPYADWIGLEPGKIVGRSIPDVMGTAAFEKLRPRIEQVLAGHEVRYEEELDYPAVGPRWVDAIYTPTYDGDSAPNGWIAVILDIDQRKRAEDALLVADRRKDEFLATLAHELRNPLAPIRNSLQILRLKSPAEPTLEAARDMIDRNVQQMVRLIDDLLDVSRITGGTLQLRRERVDLAAALRQAVEMSNPLIQSSGHRLIVTLPETPIYLSADLTRLAQIFGNLLNNAAKYTEDGGTIRLSARLEDSDAVVTVWDNGAGISAEHLPHLFEKFTRRSAQTERSRDGLGIGLSLVRGLVALHGGTVTAHSEGEGRGSTFVVRIPVAEVPAPRPEAADPVRKTPGQPVSHRILVVDDNRDSVVSLAHMLELMGHRVHTAEDGVAAVETAALVQPNVVLLDIGMPKLNGHDAARQIRSGPGGDDVILVALTGWGQKEDKRMAAEAGFDHHLTKPVDPAVLRDLLAGIPVR